MLIKKHDKLFDKFFDWSLGFFSVKKIVRSCHRPNDNDEVQDVESRHFYFRIRHNQQGKFQVSSFGELDVGNTYVCIFSISVIELFFLNDCKNFKHNEHSVTIPI